LSGIKDIDIIRILFMFLVFTDSYLAN
jgi:hypothetical protein